MKKRVLTLLLAVLMLVPMLIACSEQGQGENTEPGSATAAAQTDDQTQSLYDADGYLLDSLPDSLNFKATLRFLTWDDHTMHEFGSDVTEANGDGIDSALLAREQQTCDRLGVEIEYILTPGDSDDMNAFISKAEADYKVDNEYDVYAGYSRTAPQLTLKGYTADLLSTQYFDIEKPWWPENITKECMFGDKLFFCSGDISTNMLWMMIGTFYNKSLYEDYRFEKTPEQMVEAHEWTFDKMFSMTRDTYEDLNNDGKKDRGDRYGAVVYDTNIDAFQTAAGITSLVRANDGTISISEDWKGERCANACELTGNWLASAGVFHENSTKIRDVFFEERALFITDRVFIVAGKDNAAQATKIEFDYGIVPQPMLNAEQGDYCTNLGHPYTMYAINNRSKNIEACAATFECMGSLNYRLVTPQVYDLAMKFKYARNSEAGAMYDIIRRTVSFDLGRLIPSQFSNHTANLFRKTAIDTPASYMTKYGSVGPVVENGLASLISMIDEVVAAN